MDLYYKPDYLDLLNWCSQTAIELSVTLTENVDVQALQGAVKQAQKSYLFLNVRPAIRDGQLVYLQNAKPFLVNRSVGEEEAALCSGRNHEYPWRVTYEKNKIYLAGTEGIFDRKALVEILKTILYYYEKQISLSPIRAEGIYTMETRNLEENVRPVTRYSQEDERMSLPQKMLAQASPFAAQYMKETETSWVQYQIRCNSEQMMQQVKKMDTTPFAFFAMLLCRVFQGYMQGDSPKITFPVLFNMKKVFTSDTMHNFEMVKLMQYNFAKMERMSDETVCTVFRSIMDLALDHDSLVARLKAEAAKYDSLLEMRFDEQVSMLHSRASLLSPLLFPFTLSYLGQVDLPADIRKHVKDLDICVDRRSYPSWFEIFDYNGEMVISAYSNMNTEQPLQKLVQRLREYGITANLTNMGIPRPIRVELTEWAEG